MGRTKKFRGNRTHGRGKKAGRGAGLRGGRGNAGLHKHKFKWMLKYDPQHFGPPGFYRHGPREERRPINLAEVEQRIDEFVARGGAVVQGDRVIVNLDKLGFTKLLADGQLRRALTVVVTEASAKAVEKVAAHGGKVMLSSQEGVETPGG